MIQQEQYVHFLALSLEEVKDQNEEILERNKGLEKDVNGVKRKLGIVPEKTQKPTMKRLLLSPLFYTARKLKLNKI